MQETQETWVQSMGWEDPLEKEMTTHSSILAQGIPWTEELGGLQSMGSQRVRFDGGHLYYMHECQANSGIRVNGHEFEQASGDGKDREAWHAAVHGVAKSWT